MNVPLWVAAPVIVLVAAATQADVRTRTIPTRLTFPALLLGLALHAALGGAGGFTSALLGMAVAGGILLPGWLFRWMGAGDVKLMAAVGAALKLYWKLLRVGMKQELYEGDDIYQSGGDFLIDGNGNILFAHRSQDPADRPSAVKLLQAIDSVLGKP